MAETKHSPGPWKLAYDKGSNRDIMTNNARVATAWLAYVTPEEYHANAHLIAAAPDLLEALRELDAAIDDEALYEPDDDEHAKALDRLIEAQKAARAAIAKAEGRADG